MRKSISYSKCSHQQSGHNNIIIFTINKYAQHTHNNFFFSSNNSILVYSINLRCNLHLRAYTQCRSNVLIEHYRNHRNDRATHKLVFKLGFNRRLSLSIELLYSIVLLIYWKTNMHRQNDAFNVLRLVFRIVLV